MLALKVSRRDSQSIELIKAVHARLLELCFLLELEVVVFLTLLEDVLASCDFRKLLRSSLPKPVLYPKSLNLLVLVLHSSRDDLFVLLLRQALAVKFEGAMNTGVVCLVSG